MEQQSDRIQFARHTLKAADMSLKLASVPDRPDAAPCSEEGLVAADAPAAAAAAPAQPTVHIVAAVGSESFEFDVPADRTVEFVKAYLDNKHGCVCLLPSKRLKCAVFSEPLAFLHNF